MVKTTELKYKMTVDTVINKKGLEELRNDILKVKISAESMKIGKDLSSDLKKTAKAAEQVREALSKSWNSKLGQLDLGKFQRELQEAKLSANSIKTSFERAGKSGSYAFNKLTTNILNTNVQLKTSSKLLDDMADTFAKTVKWGISSSVFNNLTGQLSKAYDFIQDLDKSLNNIQIVSGQSAEQMKEFAKQANKAANSLGSTTRDYAEAALIFYQQGLDGELVEKRTETVIKMANVTKDAAEEVSSYMTAIWNNFYEEGGKSLEYYADVLAKLGAKTASSTSEIAGGLEKFVSVGKTIGLSYEYATSALATIVATTRQSEDTVGTALKTLFSRIQGLSLGETLDDGTTLTKYSKALNTVGISIKDQYGELKDMDDILDEMGSKWETLSKDQRVALAQTVAGVRQYNQLVSLMDNWSFMQENLNTARSAEGELNKQNETYLNSLEAHLNKITTESERLYSSIFDTDGFKGLVDIFSNLIGLVADFNAGLGGGLNSLIALANQLSIIFNKQLARGINTILENKERLKANKAAIAVQEDFITATKEGTNIPVASSKNIGKEAYDILSSAQKENAEEVAASHERILRLQKSITQEKANELISEQKEISDLKVQVSLVENYAKLVKSLKIVNKGDNPFSANDASFEEAIAKQEEKLTDNRTALQELKDYNGQRVKIAKDQKDLLLDSLKGYKEQLSDEEKIKNVETTINALKKDRTLTEEQLGLVAAAQRNTQGEIRSTIALINQLKLEGKNIDESTLADLKMQLEEYRKIHDQNLRSAERQQKIGKAVQWISFAAQGLNTLTGAIKVFGDETSTGAEKANAAWNGVGLAATGVGMAIGGPVGAMIGSGVAGIAKSIMEATGAWEWFEDKFTSTAEKVKKAEEEYEKAVTDFNNNLQKKQNQIQDLQQLKDAKDRIMYLQSLAEKGILPEDLRGEYEGYLDKVTQYNNEIMTSYDEQGNKIAVNTGLLGEYLNSLKEINREQMKALFKESWSGEDGVKAKAGAKLKSYSQEFSDLRSDQKNTMSSYKTAMQNGSSHAELGDQIYLGGTSGSMVNSPYLTAGDAAVATRGYKQIYNDKNKKGRTGWQKFWGTNTEHTELTKYFDASKWRDYIGDLEKWEEEVTKQAEKEGYSDSDLEAVKTYIANYKKELEGVRDTYDKGRKEILEKMKSQTNQKDLFDALQYDEKYSNTYEAIADTGFQSGNEVISTYMSNYIDGLTAWDFNENTYDDILNKTHDFEKRLLKILQKDPSLASKIDEINQIDKDIFSQEYEERKIELINKFLEGLSDEDYNSIKDDLAEMFGLSSISTYKDSETGKYKAGNEQGSANIVTKGEKKAREIGHNLQDQNRIQNTDGTLGYVNDFSDPVEQYLQKVLSESDLQNIDTNKFTQDFNDLLYKAIENTDPTQPIEITDEKLHQIINQAVKRQDMDANVSGLSAVSIQEAKDLGYSQTALEGYTNELAKSVKNKDKFINLTEDEQDAVEGLAISQIKLEKALKNCNEKWDDWQNNLEKVDKGGADYFQTLGEMADAFSDVFGTDVSTSFIEAGLASGDLEKALDGDVEAFNRLQEAAARDYVANLDINADEERINEIRGLLDGFIDDYIDKDFRFTVTADADDSDFIKTMNEMLKNGEITEEQVNGYLSGIGYKGKVTYVDGPETKSTSHIKWNGMSLGTIETSTTTQVPQIESITKTRDSATTANTLKTATTGSNKRGGSKGGGSSKAKENNKSDEKANIYQEVDEQLKNISTTLSRLEKQEEKVFGTALIENLNKQYEKLNNQIEITNRKLKIAKDEQSELVSSLSNYGIQFNLDGTINQQSYEEAFKREQARYTSAKTDDEAAKERWETFKEDIKNYESLTLDTIPGLIDSIQDAINKQIENNITKFNMEIELRLDLSEAEREWNEFNRKVLKGIKDDNIAGNAETRLQDLSSYYKNNGLGSIQRNASQVQRIQKELAIMRNGGTSAVYGDDQKFALEDLEKYNQQLMEDLTQIEEIREEIHEAYLDQMDEIQDKFDEQIESYEYISGLIEHNMDLVKLLKGEEAFGDLQASYDMASANLDEQLKSEMAQLEFWKKERQRAIENGDEEYIKKAEEMIKNSIESVNNTVIEKINNAKDSYINSIHAIFDEMSKQMTNGKGLAYIGQEWELINRNADRYLTNLNAMYGIQQLQDKYLQSIDSSDNVKYQQRLNKLMEDEMKALREKDKISQHDLDRANKRYEIALKQIALEEAQQAKTTMRLRRDSQGNYSYQYVADNDEMEKLKLELSELYNQLYNLDLEKYNEVLNEAYSVWQEYQEKMLEAAQINDPEERANQELLIKEQYGELINNLTAEYANLRLNLEESSMSHLFNLYGRNVENFQLMSETQQQILQKYLDERVNAEAMAYDNLFGYYNQNLEAFETMAATEKQIILDDMVPTWTNGLQEMITTLSQSTDSFIGIHDSLISQIYDKLSAYEQAVYTTTENVTGESGFGSVEEALKRLIEFTEMNISSAQSWKEQDDELIISCTNLMDAVDNVNDALETFNTAMENSEKNAKKAAEEVYNYIKAVKEADALAAKKEAEKPSTPIEPTPAPSQPVIEPEKPAPEPSKPALTRGSYVNVKTGTKWYENSYGQGKSGVARSGSIKYINTNGTHPYNIDGLGWIKKSNIVGYRTGGYTGNWSGTDGKLAFLHQKELILNANDTENILKTVALLRGVTGQLNGISANFNVQQGSGLQQDVHIEATFPNVTSSNEIENALNNLVNAASQRINRR